MEEKEYIKHLENVCWVGYISPFTLIVPNNEEPLKVTLEDINSNSYNHGKLCRIVKGYPFYESLNLDMLICYDGAIAIPKVKEFTEQESAVEFFNKLFSYLLIGGYFCEAVDKRDIVIGSLYESRAIWPVNFGNSASSHLHCRLRMRVGNNMDSIILSNPKHIFVNDFIDMLENGKKIMRLVPNLTAGFLIRGITELYYKNWSAALSNLWITVEQLTDYLWGEQFLKQEDNSFQDLPNRRKAMKEDNRTWNASVKQEILFQKGIISKDDFSLIYPARQARNKLIHEGISVPKEIAFNIFDATVSLLSKAVKTDCFQFRNLDIEMLAKDAPNMKERDEAYFIEWKRLNFRSSET